MSECRPPTISRVLSGLERDGLLMLSDARLPSLVSLVVGKPVRGSWWGHPRGEAIHVLSTQLREHPDVIALRFVRRKITYVHRSRWPELFGVATSGEQWQTKGISSGARLIFRAVQKSGLVRSDDPALLSSRSSRERRAFIRELEERLLVHCIEFHTERGVHAKALQSWAKCRQQKRFRRRALPARDARERFEALVRAWSTGPGAIAALPWQQLASSHVLCPPAVVVNPIEDEVAGDGHGPIVPGRANTLKAAERMC